MLTLAKQANALSKALTRAELNLLFVRANINRVDGGDDSGEKHKQDALLELSEFVGAISRMA